MHSCRRSGVWAALVLLGAACVAVNVGGTTGDAGSGSHVNLIVVDGGINPAVNDYIRESIQRAHDGNARALIIQLDTPGGLLSSTRSIVKEILSAPLPVIVYVAPSGAGAGSAGVFITMAANIAAMAPGTNIGAAHPVSGGGKEVKGVMGEKIENFTASFSESIARRRGRNTEFAIQAVRRSMSITDTQALEKGVIDFIATDVSDLLRQASGRTVDVGSDKHTLDFNGVSVLHFEMGLKQKVINILAHPNVAYLLMMAGILGLYMEFSNPGTLFPGIAGGIALLLALASFQVLPINYTGLLLIGLGMCLLVAEAFLPSFGLLGIGGVISLALGSLLLFEVEGSDLSLDRSIVFAAVGTLSVFVLGVAFLVVNSQRRKATLGFDGLVGEVGEVRERLDLKGKVFVHGEVWNAEGSERIEPGDRIEVVGYDRMILKVKRATES